MLTIRQKQRREHDSDFIKFVDNETLIVSDSLFSKAAVDEYLEKRPNHKRNKISAFAAEEQNKKGDPHICINCNGNHKLEKCKEFMERISEGENQVPNATETMLRMLRANE